MNTNVNNEAILLNEQILKAEESIRFTEKILQEKLEDIKTFGMPRNPSSCLQVNRHLDYLRQTLKKEKAELAALPGFVSL